MNQSNKMISPSKELLSAVLGEDVVSIDDTYEYSNNHANKLYYLSSGTFGVYTSINIYELMHMMKEWAVKNEHELMSCNGGYCEAFPKKTWDSLTKPIKEFYGDTEFEAITEACEWILKETKC